MRFVCNHPSPNRQYQAYVWGSVQVLGPDKGGGSYVILGTDKPHQLGQEKVETVGAPPLELPNTSGEWITLNLTQAEAEVTGNFVESALRVIVCQRAGQPAECLIHAQWYICSSEANCTSSP